jgi:hypothetical protein
MIYLKLYAAVLNDQVKHFLNVNRMVKHFVFLTIWAFIEYAERSIVTHEEVPRQFRVNHGCQLQHPR